ncbi:hypothetical protein GMORB2_5254 [Geosmithia morbida]|uniref:Uncharacterized protein n=1 Tax=Geosmithia morbida TaxID=1094350 RepID=A0A9P4YZP5_9HYPO|nr:uncharacterized protein GMORB2_5254 [Geosmithia morbida]KAF4124588.1 hypothetical protein GMORB2_5254 [Geosmithia morbida]
MASRVTVFGSASASSPHWRDIAHRHPALLRTPYGIPPRHPRAFCSKSETGLFLSGTRPFAAHLPLHSRSTFSSTVVAAPHPNSDLAWGTCPQCHRRLSAVLEAVAAGPGTGQGIDSY